MCQGSPVGFLDIRRKSLRNRIRSVPFLIMPPLMPNSRVVGSNLLQKDGLMRLFRSSKKAGRMDKCIPVRCSRTIAGLDRCSGNSVTDRIHDFSSLRNGCSSFGVQKRSFLGVGDGEEGGSLSKVHEERLVMGYSPEQLFAVVAAVDMYEDFVPWCQRSEIIRRNPDGSIDAELEIGFKFLVESYVSHVVMNKPRSIKTTSSQSTLFDHLINIWEFNPGPTPETCNLYFMVDFKFRSPLYRQVASMFFKEVVSRLVNSFNERCRVIYGPGARVMQQRA